MSAGNVRVVYDDAGDVPPEVVSQYGIHVMPVNIMFGTDEYLSGVNIDRSSFHEMVKTVDDSNFPKTSQPTPYQFVEAYKELIKQGADEFLTITISEKLSGTYASAVGAAKELDGQATFHLIDSKTGSAAQGFMVSDAAEMIAEGKSMEEVLAWMKVLRERMSVFFVIDSLEYAVKGGRISSMRSGVAWLLNIKPLMTVADGLIVEAGKVRTFKKAMARVAGMVEERHGQEPVRIAYIHANSPDGAQDLAGIARGMLNIAEERTVDMAVAVAINLGPGALGIVAAPPRP